MYTNEQRIVALQKAPENIQDMYGSMNTGKILGAIRQKYTIDENNNFITVVGDIMLGLYPKAQLPTLLQQQAQIPAETATQIAAELSDFLAPIPDQASSSASSTPMPQSSPHTNTPPQNPTPQLAAVQPQTVPQPIRQPEVIAPATTARPSGLTKTRTMQRDINALNRDGGGDANQQQGTVPRYAKPLTDTPKYDG